MEQVKKIKNNLVSVAKNFWADESAQGMTEYILLLVVILAIGMTFKQQIKATVEEKLGNVGESIKGF